MMLEKLLTLSAAAITMTWAQPITVPVAASFQHAGWSTGPRQPEGVQTGPVLGKAFSATETRRTTQTLNDGTLVQHSDVSRFFRDADGRMRAESPNRIEIFDPVAKVEYDLNPGKKTYTITKIPDNTLTMTVAVVGSLSVTGFSSDPPTGGNRSASGAPNTEELAAQTINGVSAKGVRVTVKVPVGAVGNNREIKIVNERWFSDELQALVKSSNNDPRFGLNSYELTNIQQGAQDAALFQVPSGYSWISKDNR